MTEDILFLLEFSESGTLEKIIRNLETLDSKYDTFKDKLNQTHLKFISSNDSKELSTFVTEIEKLKAEYSGLIKETQKADEQKKKSKQLTKEQVLEQERHRQALNAVRKEARELIKDETALTLAARKQAKSIDELKEQTNALVRVRNKLDLSTKEGRKRFEEYTAAIHKNDLALKKYDAQIGRSQRHVGDYARAFRGLGQQLLNFAGITGGIFFFKDAIDQIAQFEDALAELKSITGLSDDVIKGLGDRALEMSKKFGTSATEIIRGFALIGSKKPDLLEDADALAEVTAQAEILAKAAKISLPEAADALTKSLNQYGKGAESAAEFTDILAVSQQKGTASIEALSGSLKNVGSVANAFNLSFDTTNALLQALAKGGLEGEEAGTKLRGVLLRLAKTGRKDLDPALTDINTILNTLSKEVTTVTKAEKIFGDENAAAALTLIKQRDVVLELNGALYQQGAALSQAETNTNTLTGEIDKLSAKWQATIIEFGNGGGEIKDVVRFIRENLDTIIQTVITVTKYFILYKAAVIATKGAISLVNTATKAYAITTQLMTKGLGGALKSFKALDTAMKANVIGLVVTGVTALISALGAFETEADRAAAAQERVNEAMAKFDESRNNLKSDFDKRIQLITDQFKREKELREAQGKDTEALTRFYNARIEGEYLRASKKIEELRIADGKAAIAYEQKVQEIRAQIAENEGNIFIQHRLKKQLLAAQAERNINFQKNQRLLEDEQSLQNDIENLRNSALVDNINNRKKEKDKILELSDKEKKEREKAIEDEYRSFLNQIEQEKILEETAIERTRETEQRKAALKQQANLSYLEKRSVIEKAFGKEFVKTELEIVMQKNEIQKRQEEERQARLQKQLDIQKEFDDLDLRQITDRIEREKLEEIRAFEEKIARLEKEGILTNELEIALKKELEEKLNKLNEEQRTEQVEKDIEIMTDGYKELDLIALKSGKTREEIEKELQQNDIDRLKEEIRLRQEAGQDTLDLEIELANKENELKDEQLEKDKQRIEELKEFTEETFDAIFEARRQALEKQVEEDQKALEKQNENVRIQEERAAQGLQNTLAEEKRIQAEKQQQLLIDQKKAEKAKEIEAFFNALAEYAKEDPTTAPAKAFIQIQLAKALAAKFEDGGIVHDVTSREGVGGRIQNGIFKGRSHKRGGILIEAEGEEGILSKKEMRNLGPSNFYALKERLTRPVDDSLLRTQNERLSSVLIQREPSVDLSPLMSKMDELKKSIDEKPVPSWQVDEYLNVITTLKSKGKTYRHVTVNKGFNN